MSAQVERGYLVLADISGFTGYLAETELDHANEILGDLVGQVVEHLVPPLRLAEVEGDAVFVYGPLRRGETLLEVLEQTYAAFRHRRELMEARTTCPCNACRRIGTLELKFIVHEGEYVLQDMGGRTKLLGSDVNLAHRLLKNGLAAETGWEAYVLLSERARRAVELSADGLHSRTESYEYLGDVETWSFDLRPRWQILSEQERPEVDLSNAQWLARIEIEAPVRDLWEVLNDVEARTYWSGSDTVDAVKPESGRTGAGGVVHCHHGDKLYSHQISQFHPFDFMTEHLRVGPGMTVSIAYLLSPNATGTELTIAARLLGRYPGAIGRMVCRRGGETFMAPMLPKLREIAESSPPSQPWPARG